ncbi:hypothetical protein GGX14DRAFT_452804, partial [Mycena pura]
MVFHLTRLPNELVLLIIRAACHPNYDDVTAQRPSYATAVSLASVSHAIRSATMPYLLHTVVLASSPQVLSFIDSVLLQQKLCASASPLALDYASLVHRFWSTECWEASERDPPQYRVHYAALYAIIRGVDSLGLNAHSLHLLYNGLSSLGADPQNDWKCRHVTLAGYPRWKPLTSCWEGIAFLSHITHLTLWIPTHNRPWLPPAPDCTLVPRVIQEVPLSSLPNLTHLAFSFLPDHRLIRHMVDGTDIFRMSSHMLAYVLPDSVDSGPSVFREWALSDDFLVNGVVQTVDAIGCIGRWDLSWEFPFMQGEPDAIWSEVDRLRANNSD